MSMSRKTLHILSDPHPNPSVYSALVLTQCTKVAVSSDGLAASSGTHQDELRNDVRDGRSRYAFVGQRGVFEYTDENTNRWRKLYLCSPVTSFPDPTFAPGDVVTLKSDSYKMVITHVAAISEDSVRCVWIHRGEPHAYVFPIVCLDKVTA